MGRTFSRREKIVFAAAGVVVGLFLLERGLVSPLARAWSELDEEVASKEIQLRRELQTLEQRDAALRAEKLYSPSLQQTGSDEEEMVKLLKDIEVHARQAGVKVRDLRPQPMRKNAYGKVCAVMVTTEASWPPLAAFLHNVETSPRFLRVEKLTVNAKSDSSSVLKAQLLVNKVLLAPER
jgi:Tfp pilus assembly protein PilO